MTKNEIIEKLIIICENKIEESKQNKNDKKLQIYEVILNILQTPNFYNKQDIEVTMNILKDLDIEEEFMIEVIKVLIKED